MTLNERIGDVTKITGQLSLDYKEVIKNNEKVMIREYLRAAATRNRTQGVELHQKLEQNRNKMKQLTQHTLPTDLAGGLTGKTADAADQFLKTRINIPALENPVKGA